jgi:hypothetical protein
MPFSAEIDSVITTLDSNENYLAPIILLPHIITIFLFILVFIAMYFSYYNSSTKEENTIDHDYLSASATVEAEEEIGSLDDMLLSIIIISYIFL